MPVRRMSQHLRHNNRVLRIVLGDAATDDQQPGITRPRLEFRQFMEVANAVDSHALLQPPLCLLHHQSHAYRAVVERRDKDGHLHFEGGL